ncbi:UNVERIFIED_CONTAM: hypothetical protein HHA_230190 [Hammondia hammondi]|eukprot:XP_008889583.1 hypothetical protein HHA_230190 [Hammondia hammondi]
MSTESKGKSTLRTVGTLFRGLSRKENTSEGTQRVTIPSTASPSESHRGRSSGVSPTGPGAPELGTQEATAGTRASGFGTGANTPQVPRSWKGKRMRRSRHGVASHVRKVLRMRGGTVKPEYANVFLILGLYDGELIQNGYVCLRAADVTDWGVEGVPHAAAQEVVVIGVKAAVKPPTLTEERRAVIYLRDYLASQLTGYPFLRHCILVNKRNRRSSNSNVYYSVLGTGQYMAIVNAATQVDGMAPLEVCVVRRSGGPQFEMAGTSHRSIVGSVVGTLRSSVRELGLVTTD